jgi:hypothetical protein
MHPSTTIRLLLVAVLVVLCSMSGAVYGQSVPLIHACVDQQGRLTIIAPGGSCGNEETLLTWPAASAEPVTFYQRVSAPQPVAERFATAIAPCDDPDDVATGGGFRLDGVPISDSTSAVLTSTSCAASGQCGGLAAPDGWVVVAKSSNVAAAGTRITAYVVCATP